MTKTFLSALEAETNYTLTENLAVARATTGSELLNFFSVGGALRMREEGDIVRLFDKAFAENPKYALKALFYFRDVRGGQGERRTFRTILKYLASRGDAVSTWLGHNVSLIPEYGRWDDVLELFGTPLEGNAMFAIREQLLADLKSETPSLLAKWLPSENASSKESKLQALKIAKTLGLSPRNYRKTLSKLREKIDVLERKLSSGDWSGIDYSKVPSQANLLYRKAFVKHDRDRYTEFLSLVEKGEQKINAGVLYPYEVVRKCYEHEADEKTLDALWKALPNYIEAPEDSLVVADVSGSMYGLPIQVSISLAIYAAERNRGVFHNKFITFSAAPALQKITGSTIVKKVENLSTAQWDMNTNVEAVFRLILETAKKHKVSNDEMVKKLYIVSDMEFDSACGRQDVTLFNKIRGDYKAAGYDMPFLVFWNVNSRNDQFPMSMDDRGFLNVSGCSPSIFKGLIRSEFKDAYGFMIDILDNKRYERINFGA